MYQLFSKINLGIIPLYSMCPLIKQAGYIVEERIQVAHPASIIICPSSATYLKIGFKVEYYIHFVE